MAWKSSFFKQLFTNWAWKRNYLSISKYFIKHIKSYTYYVYLQDYYKFWTFLENKS